MITLAQLKRVSASVALCGVVLGLVAFALPHPASAFTFVPECARQVQAPGGPPPPVPSLNCLLQAVANVAQFIFGITGSVALLIFVIGGFRMIAALGNPGEVAKGQAMLKNATIGIVIIFASSIFLQYGMRQLTGSTKDALIVGSSCESSQVDPAQPIVNGKPNKLPGTVVELPGTGEKRCVGLCSEIASAGYRCVSDGTGQDCIGGLCQGAEIGQSCCRQAQ